VELAQKLGVYAVYNTKKEKKWRIKVREKLKLKAGEQSHYPESAGLPVVYGRKDFWKRLWWGDDCPNGQKVVGRRPMAASAPQEFCYLKFLETVKWSSHFLRRDALQIAYVVRPSDRPSVCNVGGSGPRPHRLEMLETNCTDI